MKKYKFYMVDDIVLSVPINKEMKGFREVPHELVEEHKPCNALVELWKKAKEKKKKNG